MTVSLNSYCSSPPQFPRTCSSYPCTPTGFTNSVQQLPVTAPAVTRFTPEGRNHMQPTSYNYYLPPSIVTNRQEAMANAPQRRLFCQSSQDRTVLPAKDETRSILRYCEVCGDKASGNHHGVVACEGCKVSFSTS